MNLPAAPEPVEVNSRSKERISALERIEERPNQPGVRVSALERLEEGTNQSADRISALERIQPPMEEDQRNVGLSDSLLARLQDVEVRYMEEDHQSPLIGDDHTGGNQQQEPQRTPASLRLGSASERKRNPPRAAAGKAAQARLALQAKKATKKPPTGKVTGSTRTRGNRSPVQGLRVSKQIALRGRPPAKKRLCVEKTGQDQNLPCNKDVVAPGMGNIAGTSRGKVDFQNPPSLIP